MIFVVQVGWTSSRPVVPDQHTSSVTLEAGTPAGAELVAAQIVACRPACVMPTSTLIVDWSA